MIRRYEFYNKGEPKEKLNPKDVIQAIKCISSEELEKYGFSSEEQDNHLSLTGRHIPRRVGISCIKGLIADHGLSLITNEDGVTINKYVSKLSELLNDKGLSIIIRKN